MALAYTSNLKTLLKGSTLIIDTCVLIHASKSDEVYKFLKETIKTGSVLLSVPVVKSEFTCRANSSQEYEKLANFIKSLEVSFDNHIELKLFESDGIKFNIALKKCQKIKPSYADRLLLFIPYFYSDFPGPLFLITSNSKDVPTEFFDCVGFITYDKDGFQNIGVYQFNKKRFDTLLTE